MALPTTQIRAGNGGRPRGGCRVPRAGLRGRPGLGAPASRRLDGEAEQLLAFFTLEIETLVPAIPPGLDRRGRQRRRDLGRDPGSGECRCAKELRHGPQDGEGLRPPPAAGDLDAAAPGTRTTPQAGSLVPALPGSGTPAPGTRAWRDPARPGAASSATREGTAAYLESSTERNRALLRTQWLHPDRDLRGMPDRRGRRCARCGGTPA